MYFKIELHKCNPETQIQFTFMDKESEPWKDQMTSPRSYNSFVAQLD